MTIFRHSNYAAPASRTDSFSPIVTSALALALGHKGAPNVRHPIAELKTLFNLRFKLMTHPVSQNIISRRFFAGTLAAILGAVSFAVSFPVFAVAPNQNPVKVFSDDFESGTSKWTQFGDKITSAIVHSGKGALHYDGWPGTDTKFSPSTREVYFKFWWYLPTGFSFRFEGGRHFWRLGLDQRGSQGGNQQFDTATSQRGNGDMDLHIFLGGTKAFNSAARLPTGRWFKFEMYALLSDPGVANGIVKIWIDGVSQLNQTNVNLLATTANINAIFATTNYAPTGVCKPSDICDWYMDDMEVWNGCPSGSSCNGGSSSVNLTPPSNLRIE